VSESLKEGIALRAELVKPYIKMVGSEVETGPGEVGVSTNNPSVITRVRSKKAEAIEPQTKNQARGAGICNNHIGNLRPIGFCFWEQPQFNNSNTSREAPGGAITWASNTSITPREREEFL
jgi:hypothetical protein